MSDNEQIHIDLNGFGRRLTEVEKMESRVTRNEEDIQKIFKGMESLPMKILALISVPTILLAYQILSKGAS